MQKSIPLLPLFEKFILETHKGKRLKPNCEKIKPQTIDNYKYVLKVLKDFNNDPNFNNEKNNNVKGGIKPLYEEKPKK